MKIIMAGATGFIGSAVADTLVRANHDVTGVAHTTEDAHKQLGAFADLRRRAFHYTQR